MGTKVINGVNELQAELEGRTVAEVRGMLSQVLNIDAVAKPIVNGEQVEETYTLTSGDELEFVKASGTKG
jgi:hypothetical protein